MNTDEGTDEIKNLNRNRNRKVRLLIAQGY
jgi:hypothetical protein